MKHASLGVSSSWCWPPLTPVKWADSLRSPGVLQVAAALCPQCHLSQSLERQHHLQTWVIKGTVRHGREMAVLGAWAAVWRKLTSALVLTRFWFVLVSRGIVLKQHRCLDTLLPLCCTQASVSQQYVEARDKGAAAGHSAQYPLHSIGYNKNWKTCDWLLLVPDGQPCPVSN